MEAPDKVLSIGQIELFDHSNWVQTNNFGKINLFDIELFDHLTVCKQTTDVQSNCYWYVAILGIVLLCWLMLLNIYQIYIYKEGLALNNLQWLICHKTKPNQTKSNQTKL